MTLLRKIESHIHHKGPLKISEFMQYALYDEDFGYYKNNIPIGKEGDFTTSPEISQLFGEMIAIWCMYNTQKIEESQEFNIVELGPGRGTLMQDLLRTLKSQASIYQRSHIHMVETSDKLQTIQKEMLKEFQDKITWHKNLDTIPKRPNFIIANEFFDAMPIDQYKKVKNFWYEVTVDIDEGMNLFFGKRMVSLDMQTILDSDYSHCQEDQLVEISDLATEYMQQITSMIVENQGAALIIDYGFNIEEKNRTNYNSTLQAIYKHKFHPVLENVGMADITYHINFNQLQKIAFQRLANTYQIITQGEFLEMMEISTRVTQLTKICRTIEQKEELYQALHRLTAPSEMGEIFKVMLVDYYF